MTLEQARQVRQEAGQPLEWPEGLKPPLSRLALTLLIGTSCEKERLISSHWNVSLMDFDLAKKDFDYSYGDSLTGALGSIWEQLQILESNQVPTDMRFGDMVTFVEETFLVRWQSLVALDASEAQLVAVLGRAMEQEVTAEAKIADVVPEVRLVGLWERLPEPWSGLWPDVKFATIWWPLSEKSWGALALWAVVTVVVMRIENAPLLGRLFLSGLGAWLCKAFLFEQPVRPLWPKELVTVGDVARAMRRELQAQLFHWETLEREWGA